MKPTPIAGEEVPEITKLEFVKPPNKPILVARFADGTACWVSWSFPPKPPDVTAKNLWMCLIARLNISVCSLEHFYLRDIKKVPRFQRVEQYPAEGIE